MSVNFQGNSRLSPSTTTPERAIQFITSGISETKWWSTLTMTRQYASSFLLAWRARHQIGSTPCHRALSTTSRRSPRPFSYSTPLAKKPRETIITSSPSRWGREAASSHISISFRASWLKVSNCVEELFTLVFINRLQVTYPLCKHLSWSIAPRWAEFFSELNLTSS